MNLKLELKKGKAAGYGLCPTVVSRCNSERKGCLIKLLRAGYIGDGDDCGGLERGFWVDSQ